MLFLQEMIEKSLLLKEFPSTTSLPDSDISSKVYSTSNSLLKNTTERWNQANLGYFDPYLNRVHRKDEIVLMGKDIYYRNVMLFVQRFQSFITF